MKATKNYQIGMFIVIMGIILTSSCVQSNSKNSDKDRVPDKTSVVEVYFKNGTKGVFNFDVYGELQMKNDQLRDVDTSYDSGSVCSCEDVVLANEINAFNVISTKSIEIDKSYLEDSWASEDPANEDKMPPTDTVQF